MTLVNFVKGTSSQIANAPIKDGTFYVDTDNRELSVDLDNTRMLLTDNCDYSIVTSETAGLVPQLPNDDTLFFNGKGKYTEIPDFETLQKLPSGDLLAQASGFYELTGKLEDYSNTPAGNPYSTSEILSYLLVPESVTSTDKTGITVIGLFSRREISLYSVAQVAIYDGKNKTWNYVNPELPNYQYSGNWKFGPHNATETKRIVGYVRGYQLTMDGSIDTGQEVLYDPTIIVYGSKDNKQKALNNIPAKNLVGLVPELEIDGTEGNKYLAGDGSWKTISLDNDTPTSIEKGGTGATNAEQARKNLGVTSADQFNTLSGTVDGIQQELQNKQDALDFPLMVYQGGTGKSFLTAYQPLIGGTTTGVIEQVTSTNTGAMYRTATNTLPVWGTLPVEYGGTGKTLWSSGGLVYAMAGTTLGQITNASGALYNTSSTGTPKFGTLPVAQGGTGVTSIDALKTAIGVFKGATAKTAGTTGLVPAPDSVS